WVVSLFVARPVPEEVSDPGMLAAMLHQLLAYSNAIRFGHLDELKSGSGRECLRLQRLLSRMPPSDPAARLDADLAPGPGQRDLGGVSDRKRLGLLDEHAREPQVDRENLPRGAPMDQDGLAHERNAQGPKNVLGRNTHVGSGRSWLGHFPF